MIKDTIFELLIGGLYSDNVNLVIELVTQNPCLVKTFDAAQLCAVNEILSSASLTQHPYIFDSFVQTNIYKKHGGGAGAFLNELPLAIPLGEHVERFFTSSAAQKAVRGYPDCIDFNTINGTVQGFELKNLSGRQYLPELKFGNRYDIMTHVNHFDYYRNIYPDCRLRSNHGLYNPDFFNRQHLSTNTILRMKSTHSYDLVNGIKYCHIFKK